MDTYVVRNSFDIDIIDNGGKCKIFQGKFLQPGFVQYNFGLCLLEKENADKFVYKFVGCPLVVDHQDVTDGNVSDVGVGNITRVWYNDLDGWYWCEGAITDSGAVDLIKRDGYSISCQYEITDWSPSDQLHNGVKFDKYILDGAPEHLAIVKNPRYEGAMIAVNKKDEDGHWVTIDGEHVLIRDKKSSAEKDKDKQSDGKDKSRDNGESFEYTKKFNSPEEFRQDIKKFRDNPKYKVEDVTEGKNLLHLVYDVTGDKPEHRYTYNNTKLERYSDKDNGKQSDSEAEGRVQKAFDLAKKALEGKELTQQEKDWLNSNKSADRLSKTSKLPVAKVKKFSETSDEMVDWANNARRNLGKDYGNYNIEGYIPAYDEYANKDVLLKYNVVDTKNIRGGYHSKNYLMHMHYNEVTLCDKDGTPIKTISMKDGYSSDMSGDDASEIAEQFQKRLNSIIKDNNIKVDKSSLPKAKDFEELINKNRGNVNSNSNKASNSEEQEMTLKDELSRFIDNNSVGLKDVLRRFIANNKKDGDGDGRWVTIKGTHVFIPDGKSVDDVMKEKGWSQKGESKKQSGAKKDKTRWVKVGRTYMPIDKDEFTEGYMADEEKSKTEKTGDKRSGKGKVGDKHAEFKQKILDNMGNYKMDANEIASELRMPLKKVLPRLWEMKKSGELQYDAQRDLYLKPSKESKSDDNLQGKYERDDVEFDEEQVKKDVKRAKELGYSGVDEVSEFLGLDPDEYMEITGESYEDDGKSEYSSKGEFKDDIKGKYGLMAAEAYRYFHDDIDPDSYVYKELLNYSDEDLPKSFRSKVDSLYKVLDKEDIRDLGQSVAAREELGNLFASRTSVEDWESRVSSQVFRRKMNGKE